MPTNKWICDKCNRAHDSEKRAQSCEETHPSPEDIEITHVSYSPGRRPVIPEKITIRYGKGMRALATYKVSSY